VRPAICADFCFRNDIADFCFGNDIAVFVMINLCNHLGHAPHVSRLGKSLGPTWLHLVALRHGNPLAAAAALLGVTGQSESNIGRVFRGPGVVLMMFDAFVAAGAVASPSSSLAAGSVSCRPKRSACGCLRGSRPGDFPDNFYLEALDRQHRRGRSLPATSCVTRCVAAAWLEIDDPPTAVHPHANPRGPLPSS
jgi:hypothetical protein